jgi:fucose permease
MTVTAYVLLLRIGLSSDYWPVLFPTFALIGVAFGLTFPTLNIAATDGARPEEQGVASGLFQTSAQFGTALLLAVTTAVIQATTHHGSSSGVLRGYRVGLLVPLISAAVVLALTAVAAARRPSEAMASIPVTIAEHRPHAEVESCA